MNFITYRKISNEISIYLGKNVIIAHGKENYFSTIYVQFYTIKEGNSCRISLFAYHKLIKAFTEKNFTLMKKQTYSHINVHII